MTYAALVKIKRATLDSRSRLNNVIASIDQRLVNNIAIREDRKDTYFPTFSQNSSCGIFQQPSFSIPIICTVNMQILLAAFTFLLVETASVAQASPTLSRGVSGDSAGVNSDVSHNGHRIPSSQEGNHGKVYSRQGVSPAKPTAKECEVCPLGTVFVNSLSGSPCYNECQGPAEQQAYRVVKKPAGCSCGDFTHWPMVCMDTGACVVK
ncbi:hypothetical protein P170DRAFT_494314 [Aspergillus steynii IBT 23096]|uniref:Uncharacterized protein n=1 Tax=Aspergillus steynii IBT 23096 TaxID=1392250 RepID=A0A2I2G7H0_9EURO|nr:uncharacterized protein P170DRAFT_494314 [Aspergillus steynii IBT 23096]PLB48808.1 hypothetical protein P170DRAFT_494314 [Aspergillus steynii IBT 23096]